MIGIVVVSHSAKLAAGVCELANQMTQGQVPLACVGGLEDAEHSLGTDPVLVQQAIEAVYGEDGVLVLMDLGSALLSAEMALELLPAEYHDNVYLCEAPLVEGAVAAAVQALASNDIRQVLVEARGSLAAKSAQLGVAPAGDLPGQADQTCSTHQATVTMRNQLGLHARPAAQFVSLAAQYRSRITVRNVSQGLGPVDARSINGLMALDARRGHKIGLSATGAEANVALDALVSLIEGGFGEIEISPQPETSSPRPASTVSEAGTLAGIPVSPGIAIGPLARYQPAPLEVIDRTVEHPQAEWQRLQRALELARQEIQASRDRARRRIGENEAAIFGAHLLFLKDPDLVPGARYQIFENNLSAEAAWQSAIDRVVAKYGRVKDPYLQSRALDITDVGRQVQTRLVGAAAIPFQLSQPSVVAATVLAPADVDRLDPGTVLGLCTSLGTATDHSAILARALGIPTVMGLGPALNELVEGTPLILDGQEGRVWVSPRPDTLSKHQARREAWLQARQSARETSQQPASTQDGHRIVVMANIRNGADIQTALDHGAEGVGLLRTEFLFLHRTTAPTEAEQRSTYRTIVEQLDGRPLTIRTLDVGGDKSLPYLPLQVEPNPFLGRRGIRLGLRQPELLKAQLRAILRASVQQEVKLMFPLIATLTELRAAKALLLEARTELKAEQFAFNESVEVGIMIEVPAAVAIADKLAAEVDFFSIGTNDLSQYVMAADRTNRRVSDLADPFQPAVLRLIQRAISAGHEAGIKVGLCGEFAGDPYAVPLLMGMGLDQFSLNPASIPVVKQVIAQLTIPQTQALVAEAFEQDSAADVRRLVSNRFSDRIPSVVR
jgi:phosphocarrier protein FPr